MSKIRSKAAIKRNPIAYNIDEFDREIFNVFSEKGLRDLEIYRKSSLKKLIKNECIYSFILVIFVVTMINSSWLLDLVAKYLPQIKIFLWICVGILGFSLLREIDAVNSANMYLSSSYSHHKNKKRGGNLKKISYFNYILGFAILFSLCFYTKEIMEFVLHYMSLGLCLCISYIIYGFIYTMYAYKAESVNLKDNIFKNYKAIIYDPLKSQFSDNELKGSEIFASYDTAEYDTYFGSIGSVAVDDTFYGRYQGVNFNIEETNLRKVFAVGLMGDKKSVYPLFYPFPVFKGLIIRFKFKDSVKGKTLFATRRDWYIFNNILAPYLIMLSVYILIYYVTINFCPFVCLKEMIFFVWCLSFICFICHSLGKIFKDIASLIRSLKLRKRENFEDVKLESNEWQKRFKAYTTNQVDARYLLTPAFMQRFLNLTTAFGTNKAKCSFYDDKIMIAISTRRNLFEVGNLFTPVSGDKLYEELKSILDMIEYFKLNEHTGL